ncbi:hypothetical protein WA158_007515 [Blastocystis sp. Blastoise]
MSVEKAIISLPSKPQCFSINSSSTSIICGLSSLEGKLWNGCLVNIDLVHEKQLIYQTKFGISSVLFVNNDSVLVCGDENGLITFYDISEGFEHIKVMFQKDEHESEVNQLLLCPFDSSLLLSSSTDGFIRIWDLHEYTLQRVCENTDFSTINACLWNKSRREFYSISNDRYLRVWNIDKSDFIEQYHLPYTPLSIYNTSLETDLFIITTEEGFVLLFNMKTKQYTYISLSKLPIYCCIQLKDSLYACASDDTNIYILDISTKQIINIIQTHSDYIRCLLKISENQFISASWDSTLVYHTY